MDGADALRLCRALAAADRLAQAVVADLDHAVFEEDVGRLEVAVDDAVIVQVGDGAGQAEEPFAGQLARQPVADAGRGRR